QDDGPLGALWRHEDEAERRVEHPGGELSEERDLELVPTRRKEPVAEDEKDVATEDDERGEDRNSSGCEHEDRRGADHEAIGEWIGHLPERGFDLPAAREKAVELIRECRGREE